ncbi:MAG TPA: hypothetical protein VKF32_06705, partial [Thermoanaerobaculia bacterium]|nr:hypothetical protein [Thermoanaerobaculia bacterium]
MERRSRLLAVLALVSAARLRAAGPTFTVDSTLDGPDANVGDGICANATKACTLRAAIMEANAQTDATILLPGGLTYTLTIPPGCGGTTEACGDLNVEVSMTI